MSKTRWFLNQNYQDFEQGTELFHDGEYFYDQTRTLRIYSESAAFGRMVKATNADETPISRIITVIDNGKTVQCTRTGLDDFDAINLLMATAYTLLKEQPFSEALKHAHAIAIANQFYTWSSDTQATPLQ